MTDRYQRKIEYLRLSVTDLCNFRCRYCMEKDGVMKKSHSEILSIEELTEIARCCYELGVKKIRLTGGEPLLRRGVITLCRNIKSIDKNIELVVTTNGSMLKETAHELKDAGVDRLNISLDTLNFEKFREITRGGDLNDVLKGIEAAERAGFQNTKINTVLIGGFNDDEIPDLAQLAKDKEFSERFIELMPMGVTAAWDKRRFVSSDAVMNILENAEKVSDDGAAQIYRIPGYKGTIGLISPLSHLFCDRCDKIRVTADGKLKPCLHSDDEINLRGLHGEELKNAIIFGVNNKPQRHHLDTFLSDTKRYMNQIGG